MADLDVTIMGAGPAGSVAATILARKGHRVAIIEQHRFPRDKVCGECLSSVGIDVLDRLSLKQSLASSRPTRLSRSELISRSGEIASIELPRTMWGLSRATLDATLLSAARDAGAQIFQPARFEHDHIRDLSTNQTHPISTRLLIRADGKASRVTTSDLGVKAHFRDVDSDAHTISLFGLQRHYVGLAPIERGTWNLAMSVPAERVRSLQGDLNRLFAQILGENVELEYRFRRAARITDWQSSPLPRFAVSQTWKPNEIPIGNAAAALEPIGGEGMGLAMRSAELAADAIDLALRTDRPVDVASLRRAYQRLWTWRSRAARVTAMLMSRPGSAELLVAALQSFQPSVRPLLAPLGK